MITKCLAKRRCFTSLRFGWKGAYPTGGVAVDLPEFILTDLTVLGTFLPGEKKEKTLA
jgi:hypothetical protein